MLLSFFELTGMFHTFYLPYNLLFFFLNGLMNLFFKV